MSASWKEGLKYQDPRHRTPLKPVDDTAPRHRDAAKPSSEPFGTSSIHIHDMEAAINWWRARRPSKDGITSCEEVRALAKVYALMVYQHLSEWPEADMSEPAQAAWLAWYATTPDTPCIAICSTSQGDAVCKGCGRRFDEVQTWLQMTPPQKRSVWRRITQEGTAWRFNRYAERVQKG